MTEKTPKSAPQLVLCHASKRSFGNWGPDDWDVVQDGRDIGRVFKPSAGVPGERAWMWCVTGAIVKPSHGFTATIEEAYAKFAETWCAWFALNR